MQASHAPLHVQSSLCSWFTIAERKRAQSIPDGVQVFGSLAQKAQQVGGWAPPECLSLLQRVTTHSWLIPLPAAFPQCASTSPGPWSPSSLAHGRRSAGAGNAVPWLLAKAVADSVYAAATGLPPVNTVPLLKGYTGQSLGGGTTQQAGQAAGVAGVAAVVAGETGPLPAPAAMPGPAQGPAARRSRGAVLPAVLALQEALGKEGEDDLPVGASQQAPAAAPAACEAAPAAAKRSRVATDEAAGPRVPADVARPQQPVVEQPASAAAEAAPLAGSPASNGGGALAQGIVKIEEALQLAGETGAQREAAEAQGEAAAMAAGSSEQVSEQVDSDIEMLCS